MDLDAVTGAGYISDDSDFYGTTKIRRELESRSDKVNPLQLIREWAKHRAAHPAPSAAPIEPPTQQILYNRLEGLSSARQLSETVNEFLKRLPPRTTFSTDAGPWIWITCPIVKGKGKKAADSGHEPESGVSDDTMERATRLLRQYDGEQKRIKRNNPSSAHSTITRKLSPLREKLKEDLLDLAVAANTTNGKWMLFPNEDDVSRVWKLVAEAVVDGRLGDTAKVATADPPNAFAGTQSTNRGRLICIYTKDFSDLDDIRRVVNELVNLGLAPRPGQGRSSSIYYKCDFYTYLGIDSKNDYGLKASLYSSQDLLNVTGTSKRKQQDSNENGFKAKQQTLTALMSNKRRKNEL